MTGTHPANATPDLGGPNFTSVPYHTIDPQIAAGPTRVAVTEYDQIYFLTKDGARVTHVNNDAAQPLLPVSLRDIFAPLWDPNVSPNMNDALNLPSTVRCFRDHPLDDFVDVNSVPVPNYCLTRPVYDARVLYDEFRNRFVIVASAFNPMSKCKYNPAAKLDARRNKLVVAYSKSSDPTDGSGWRVSWFDAVPGESCTTDACRASNHFEPGTAADYPVIGLNDKYLMVSIENNHPPTVASCSDTSGDPNDYPDKTSVMHVRNADVLASGSVYCVGLCGFAYFGTDLQDTSGRQVTGEVVPANTHGASFMNDAWFAKRDASSTTKVNLWHFSLSTPTSRPSLHRVTATLPAFDAVSGVTNKYRQAITSDTPNPANVQINFTPSLAQQDGFLYYADVGGMATGSQIDASIRLAGLIGTVNADNSVSFSLGRNHIFNATGIGYGSPAVEADEQRNIVMTYRKVGRDASDPTSLAHFGARYLTWAVGETTPVGRTLADNENSIPRNSNDDTIGDFDNAGIALSPDGRVYMMEPYVNASRGWSYAVNYVDP